jgi:hypothetical protein
VNLADPRVGHDGAEALDRGECSTLLSPDPPVASWREAVHTDGPRAASQGFEIATVNGRPLSMRPHSRAHVFKSRLICTDGDSGGDSNPHDSTRLQVIDVREFGHF